MERIESAILLPILIRYKSQQRKKTKKKSNRGLAKAECFNFCARGHRQQKKTMEKGCQQTIQQRRCRRPTNTCESRHVYTNKIKWL